MQYWAYILIALLVAAIALIAAGAYVLAPNRRRDTTPFRNVRFAHRGLHSGDSRVPENSLAAFRLAANNGYAVELDVQFTADRQIVVFHDDTLNRVCGVDGRVDEWTYEQLQTLTLLNSQERIPLFSEVLEVLDGVPLLCEFKAMRRVDDTSLCAAAWPLLQQYKGPFCVESFNPYMIKWFRKNQPQVIRGSLSMDYKKNGISEEQVSSKQQFMLTNLMSNVLCRPDFIAYCQHDTDTMGFRLCRWLFHPLTMAWTVTSEEKETEANRCFDTVIFEGYRPKPNK